MYRNLKIVKVDYRYCDYLRKFDNKVAYNAGNKELRPFIGVLFEIENMKYFAPLSSPKEKHSRLKNTLDLLKIDGGKFGVINFNNMIRVYENNYEELAYETVCSEVTLGDNPYRSRDFKIQVAKRDHISEIITV